MWLSSKLMKNNNSFLVSIVNKSQYRDTHSEDTISNMQDTDYLSFLFGAVNSKQHTINTIWK